MTNLSSPTRALVALAALAAPCLLPVQSAYAGTTSVGGQSQSGTSIPAAPANGAPENSAPAQMNLQPPVAVPALNGVGLIVLDPETSPLLSIGFDGDVGWDSSNVGGSSGLVTASPYVALQSRLGHTQFIVQYNPLFAKYTQANYGGENLQRASARLVGTISPRWNWNAGGTFAYGTDSTRLLAPTESVPVGDFTGVGPDTAVYSPNAGTGTFVNAGAGLTFLKSQRDSIEIQAGDSYGHFSGIAGDTSTQSARISYNHRVSPTFGFVPYGQLLTSMGSVSCVSIGGGAGIEWQLAQRTGLSLGGGPQFGTKHCGTQQSYLFNAALSTQLSNASQLYIVAGRQFSSPYLGPGLWQNTVGAGYQRTFNRSTTASLDLSYAGSTGTGTGSDYQGVFLGGSFGRTLGKLLNSSVSYRRIMSRTGSSSLNRDTIVFSINWNSSSIPILQRNKAETR